MRKFIELKGRGIFHRACRPVLAALSAFLAAGWLTVPAGAEPRTGRMSLRIGGGLNLLGWGDVEVLRDSFQRQVLYGAEQLGLTTSGACENPLAGKQVEVELTLDVTRRFGLGLGVGWSSRKGDSELRADLLPFLASRHVWNQGSRVTTVALSGYWHIHSGVRSAAYLKAGACLAAAEWTYLVREEEAIDFASWEQIAGTARDKGVAFHAGGGYEFRISKKLSVFLEARGQLLSLDDWQTNLSRSSDADTGVSAGRLWLAETYASNGRPGRAFLLVSVFSPDAGAGTDVRPLRLNLSGCVFLAGIRLELGGR